MDYGDRSEIDTGNVQRIMQCYQKKRGEEVVHTVCTLADHCAGKRKGDHCPPQTQVSECSNIIFQFLAKKDICEDLLIIILAAERTCVLQRAGVWVYISERSEKERE